MKIKSGVKKKSKMDKQQQIKLIEEWLKKFDLPKDAIDLKAEIDSKLTYQENKEHIKELVKLLINSQKLQEQKAKEKGKRTLEEEQEKVEQEQIKLEEEYTKKEFDKAIISILNNTSQEVNSFFEPLKEHIRAVALNKGNLNSLFIYGGGGMGKSTIVLSTLKELEQNYFYVSSYSTIVELVNFLYKNKDKNIVFDDFENLLKNDVALNILKSALWGIGKENKRIVSYLTTSQKLTAPAQFEFKGKCYFCLNEIPQDNPLLKALFSRSLKYNLDFNYKELMLLLAEISKLPYKELSLEQRQEVFNFIKENTDETCLELSIRTLIKAFDLFETSFNCWKNITLAFLKKDRNLSILKKLLNENFSLKDVEKKYCDELCCCRTTFFNHLKIFRSLV